MRDEDDEMDPAADPGRVSCARALTLRTPSPPSGHSTILYTETRDILQEFFLSLFTTMCGPGSDSA